MSYTDTKRALFILALAGLAVSGYLLIAYVSPIPLVCDSTGGCVTVQASKYSSFFGIPTPFFGVVFYATLGILAALQKEKLTKYFTAIGLLVSIYLSYLEAFVIEAWCLWCVVSALLTVFAFVIAWLPEKRSFS